jgi:hypothetical protein
MTVFPNFLRSLVLTVIFSFCAPLCLIVVTFASLSAIACIPALQSLADAIACQVSAFLATFGSGTPLEGTIVICLTCTFVGALFDTYVFYRYQNLRGN